MSGTASDQLFGTCEGLWEPDMVRSAYIYISISHTPSLFRYIANQPPSIRLINRGGVETGARRFI